MEKYEINRNIESFKEKIGDFYVALKIEDSQKKIPEFEVKVNDPNLWNDSKNAQQIIAEYNKLKNKIKTYNDLNSRLSDLVDLVENDSSEEASILIEEEIESLRHDVEELEVEVTLSGPYDDSGCIVEFHPGAGGTESMDWASMLFRMYQHYASIKGFKFNIIDYQPGEAGIKSATVEISGAYAYGFMKGERGVHRLVRISPFDTNKRRHTSFASIDVAPVLENSNEIELKDEDIRIDTYCSSGAGGQGVNTTYSAVRVTHIPTNIVVTCQQERSQIKNKELALRVLKSKLLELKIKQEEEELRKLKGEQMDIGFGSQIRSYVFCPYTLVKDHRTGYETGNIDAVMDGQIDEFARAYLKMEANNA